MAFITLHVSLLQGNAVTFVNINFLNHITVNGETFTGLNFHGIHSIWIFVVILFARALSYNYSIAIIIIMFILRAKDETFTMHLRYFKVS